MLQPVGFDFAPGSPPFWPCGLGQVTFCLSLVSSSLEWDDSTSLGVGHLSLAESTPIKAEGKNGFLQ